MARLYADENFPHPVVLELRRLGHEVLTIQEAGKAGQRVPDEMVLAEANAGDEPCLRIIAKISSVSTTLTLATKGFLCVQPILILPAWLAA